MANNAVSYLAIYLDPLAKYLESAHVTDVYVNRPSEIWVETLGGEIERYDVPELSEALLGRVLSVGCELLSVWQIAVFEGEASGHKVLPLSSVN